MKQIVPVLALVTLVAALAATGSQPFRLEEHRWKHRLLVLFADDHQNSAYREQVQNWRSSTKGMNERDLLLVLSAPGEAAGPNVTLVNMETGATLRKQLRVGDEPFTVLLVGKDGGVKLRRNKPVSAMELFGLIDSMPMRQQEMRGRQ